MGDTTKKIAGGALTGGLLGGGAGAFMGGALGGSGGLGGIFGGGPATVNTSSSSAPNKYTLPAYQQFLSSASNYAKDPNSMASGLNADQNQALGMIRSNATGGNGLLNAANQTMQDTAGGKYLDPNSNPYLQSTIDKALGSVRGTLGSTFSGQNFGSSAHEQLMNRESMNAIAPTLFNNYQNERGLQMNASAMAPQFAYNDANQLLNAGNVTEDEKLKRLGLLQSAVGTGISGGLDTVGVAPNPNQGSTLGNILGTGAVIGGLMGG